MNKSNATVPRLLLLSAGTWALLSTTPASAQSAIADQVLNQQSPWATTAIYQELNGKLNKQDNFIDDSSISAGTISSAQYRNGMFVFLSMSDYRTGAFDADSLISSLNAVAAGQAAPQGFAYGDYEIIKDAAGNDVRRIRNASFAPSAVIDRMITEADKKEFTYRFTAANGNTYQVEHRPYKQAFTANDYPDALQAAVDQFFDAKLTPEKRANYALTSSSPWATTAIYREVNGAPDKGTNFIDDPAISRGTISSAQYRDGHFVFLSMQDYTSGKFDVEGLIQSLADVAAGTAGPSGFAYGDYSLIQNSTGNSVRRITNASFAPSAVIDRVVTTANAGEFTYKFSAGDGHTYYVEHKPYRQAFDGKSYPKQLQQAVDQFFAAQ